MEQIDLPAPPAAAPKQKRVYKKKANLTVDTKSVVVKAESPIAKAESPIAKAESPVVTEKKEKKRKKEKKEKKARPYSFVSAFSEWRKTNQWSGLCPKKGTE